MQEENLEQNEGGEGMGGSLPDSNQGTVGETPPVQVPQGQKGEEFKLERYKYILQEQHELSAGVHKYLNLFQVLATSIIGAGVLVFVEWQSSNLSAAAARVTIEGLLGLLVILATFLIVSIVAGAISWFDYRTEEVALLDKAVKPGFRNPPKWRNLWRWNETYVVLFVIICVFIIYRFVQNQILPLIV